MAGLRGMFVAQDGSSNGTTPVGARLATSGLLAHNGASAFDSRVGVLYDGVGAVVSGTATMSYNIRAAVFATTYSAANGPTLSANDGVVNVATTAAPGSNSRIDVVWVRQNLLAADGGSGTVNTLEFGVVQGTAAASPSVPATPSGALSLAQVTVAAGVTATTSAVFTRSHRWTVANGAPIPMTTTERGLVTPYAGMSIYNLTTLATETHNGTEWSDTGWVNITLASGYKEFGPEFTPQIRRIGNVVKSRGLVSPNSGTFGTSGVTVVSALDSHFMPVGMSEYYVGVSSNSSSPTRGLVSSVSGAFLLNFPVTGNTYASMYHTWLV